MTHHARRLRLLRALHSLRKRKMPPLLTTRLARAPKITLYIISRLRKRKDLIKSGLKETAYTAANPHPAPLDSHVPDDALLIIARKLPFASMVALSGTSTRMRQVCKGYDKKLPVTMQAGSMALARQRQRVWPLVKQRLYLMTWADLDTSINVFNLTVTDSGLERLPHFPHLVHLSILVSPTVRFVGDSCSNVVQLVLINLPLVEELPALPHATFVNLVGIPLKQLPEMPVVKKLTVSTCRHLTGGPAVFPRLACVNLYDLPMLIALSEMPQVVDFHGALLPSLTDISEIRSCPEVRLTNVNVTEAHIRSLLEGGHAYVSAVYTGLYRFTIAQRFSECTDGSACDSDENA